MQTKTPLHQFKEYNVTTPQNADPACRASELNWQHVGSVIKLDWQHAGSVNWTGSMQDQRIGLAACRVSELDWQLYKSTISYQLYFDSIAMADNTCYEVLRLNPLSFELAFKRFRQEQS